MLPAVEPPTLTSRPVAGRVTSRQVLDELGGLFVLRAAGGVRLPRPRAGGDLDAGRRRRPGPARRPVPASTPATVSAVAFGVGGRPGTAARCSRARSRRRAGRRRACGLLFWQVAGVAEAQPDREQRDRQHQQDDHADRANAGHGRRWMKRLHAIPELLLARLHAAVRQRLAQAAGERQEADGHR